MLRRNNFEQIANQLKIGRPILLDTYRSIFLDSNEVSYLIQNGYATYANEGGLVIGKFHSQGGVALLRPSGEGYEYIAEMEGYEFLLTSGATRKHLTILNQINSHKPDFYSRLESIFKLQSKSYKVPDDIKKIDLRKLHFHIILLPNREGNFIVNRYATKKNLVKLNYLNNDFS